MTENDWKRVHCSPQNGDRSAAQDCTFVMFIMNMDFTFDMMSTL